MLKLTIFVVIFFAGIDAGPVVYNEPVKLSSLDKNWHFIPVENGAGSVHLFDDEPNLYGKEEEDAETMSMYDRIYDWTLKPLLDWTDWMLSPVMSMYAKTMNMMGFGGDNNTTDAEDDAPKSRRKRGVVGSVANTAVNTVHLPLSFIYDIALAPFRIIIRIFSFITAPFRAVFNKIGSIIVPSSFRNKSQSSPNVVLALLSNTGSPTTGNEEMWNQLMNSMGKVAKRSAVKMLSKGWDYTKADIMPSLDALVQKYGESDLLPEDLKKMLKNFHRVYQVTHMFNII